MDVECGTPALHAADKCSCAGIFWTDTVGAEEAEYDRQSVHGGRFHQCDCNVRCYSPGLEHNRCQAGHPIHFDTTGRYEQDTWVHCLIADVVSCPHDTEQILDVRPGKHRVTS